MTTEKDRMRWPAGLPVASLPVVLALDEPGPWPACYAVFEP